MLSGPRLLALLAAALCLTACDTARQPLEPPVHIEASYRLVFNDLLVGRALFALRIDADGGYRIDAFTVPAGQMQKAAGHEVLETSEGRITPEVIRPRRFDHSVMDGERIDLLALLFDWDRHTLHLRGQERERDIALLPGTHDRLSYLLAARRLAVRGEGMMQIQVASPEASEEALLEVVEHAPIEVPLGHYQAVAISRITPDTQERRMLWFDTKFAPLPLRVTHVRDGNTVEMQLEGLNRRPNDPR